MIGNRTRIKVVKNKVAPPFKEAIFDIIYGKGAAREGIIIDLAVELDLIQKSGSWFSMNDQKIGQGKDSVKAFMAERPEVLDELEQKIREHYGLVMRITAIEIQKNNQDRKSIFVDGEYRFSLTVEDFFKLGLKAGQEISEEELEHFVTVSSVSKCKNYVLKLLARKLYTEKELRNKMRDKGFLTEASDEVVSFLKEYGYINDRQFAKSYISDSIRLRKKGKRLIRMELLQKGIEEELISELLDGLETDEALDSLIEKKARSLDLSDKRNIKKIFDFCARRGYPYDEIRQAVNRFAELDEE